ncbi:MAG TPA: glycosyltransferase family 4 protein [Acidobacteriaceae bacterium]
MKVAISAVRPFHVTMMANALLPHADSVSIYSSAPRRFFGKLDDRISTHLVPSPVEVLGKFVRLPKPVILRGITVWDRLVAAAMPRADLVIGLATQSLATGRAARRRNARFALDRACPHVDFQQRLVQEESAKVGALFEAEPAWFRDRQLAEYETADAILTPSHYTARTFPAALRHKVLVAPLLGRARFPGQIQLARNTPFTVGVLGGHPLRKGYLYLLEAWKQLGLPNTRLVIRSSSDFTRYPRLAELLKGLPNVELVDYIPNIAEFYQRCDLFVLPSVDDGFGMALFEAMANGVPSISTRNCGASELLINGREGLVIDARSVDQLAEAILKPYADEDLRQSIALAGQDAVTRITASGAYETVLSQLLNGAAPLHPPVLMAV